MIPLHAEQVDITRVTSQTGRVKISTSTRSREQLVEEVLAEEHARVARVAIGTLVETAPEVRHEGNTTIIPVLEEVIVVEKKLFLKEEIHVIRERTTSVHREWIDLREQHAEVTRTQGDETRHSAKPDKSGVQDG